MNQQASKQAKMSPNEFMNLMQKPSGPPSPPVQQSLHFLPNSQLLQSNLNSQIQNETPSNIASPGQKETSETKSRQWFPVVSPSPRPPSGVPLNKSTACPPPGYTPEASPNISK